MIDFLLFHGLRCKGTKNFANTQVFDNFLAKIISLFFATRLLAAL